MRGLIVLALWLMVWPALSHQEGETPVAELFDCDHPPAAALNAVPPELADFARLECSPRGQFFMAGDGWTWRFPGSFFDLPSIAAYTPRASQRIGEGRYFRSIEVREIGAEESAQLQQRFTRELATYRSAPPVRMLHLAIENDAGHRFEVFMTFEGSDKGWVISCVPDCPPEYVFLMERFQQ